MLKSKSFGLVRTFVLAFVAMAGFDAFAASPEPTYEQLNGSSPPFGTACVKAANVAARKKAQEVAWTINRGMVTDLFNPDEPSFIVGSDATDQSPNLRAKQIANGYLVGGDMMYMVYAAYSDAFREAILPEAREKLIGPPGKTFRGGVVIVRCSATKPTQVEKIWWQEDVVAR